MKLLLCVLFLALAAAAPAAESALAIFAQRGKIGLEAAAARLRERMAHDAADPQARYFLASTMLEMKGPLSSIVEALTLLDGLEKEREPAWLPAWTLARRMEAAVQIQQLNRVEGAALPESVRALTGDAEFQAFLRQQLTSLDGALGPMREGLQRAASLARTKFSGEEVRADLRQLHELLQTQWAYAEEKQRQTGRSLAEALAKAEREIQTQMTRREANALLIRFVASLEDGHTFLAAEMAESVVRLSFRALDTSDGVTIAEAAEHLPLRPGDRLLAIDGRPIETVVSDWAALCSVSTAAARRTHAIARLPISLDPGQKMALRVERAGQELDLSLAPDASGASKWTSEVERGPWVRSRLITPQVGLVRVATWSPVAPPADAFTAGVEKRAAFFRPLFREIDAALAPLAGCGAIVIDLRGNGGGYDDLACYFASYFIDERPVRPYVLRYRAPLGGDGKPLPGAGADGFLNEKRAPATYAALEGPAWKPRVFVLVDALCFSATDTFLHLLTDRSPADRVTTIGRASAGGIGGPKSLGRLTHTGAQVTVSSCKAFSVAGALLEGHPARLDVPITWTRADLLAGRDPDLEAALRGALGGR